jgi:hypothetical protein
MPPEWGTAPCERRGVPVDLAPGLPGCHAMQLGKRYVCEEAGVEIVVTKGGDAVITCVNKKTGETYEFKLKDQR